MTGSVAEIFEGVLASGLPPWTLVRINNHVNVSSGLMVIGVHAIGAAATPVPLLVGQINELYTCPSIFRADWCTIRI